MENLSLADAMRLGAAQRPQCKFVWFSGGASCAMGAVIEGNGHDVALVWAGRYDPTAALMERYPELGREVSVPAGVEDKRYFIGLWETRR